MMMWDGKGNRIEKLSEVISIFLPISRQGWGLLGKRVFWCFFYYKGSFSAWTTDMIPYVEPWGSQAQWTEGSWKKVQLCGAFLKGLGRAQIHLSPPYILWQFSPKGIQENSRNGAVNLQHTSVEFICGGKTKHVQKRPKSYYSWMKIMIEEKQML